MKSKKRWAVSYLVSVLVFSVIYYISWQKSPDSFIVNQELNSQPFADINQFIWGEEDNYQIGYTYSLNALKESYDKVYKEIASVLSQLEELKLKKAELEESSKELSKKHADELERNFVTYDEKMLAPYKDAEREQQLVIERLERELPKEVETQKDVDKIKELGEEKIKLAQLRVNTAAQATKNSQEVLDNPLRFVSDAINTEFNRIMLLERQQYEEWRKLELSRGELRVKAIEEISANRKLVLSKVGWVDFWFYSVGISTTTTFGDLVPNNKSTKLLVSLQLLICVFILGGFVNAVIKS
ncbi:hypothetical protein HYO26_22645 [Vibrio parahaemolyticus]|nr:hypothetical protein [Vibrio parahaemolyticus]